MSAYYNENDPFASAWLRELIKADLIAQGEVDDRSIEDVQPDDLKGFRQCHFFAGIGGWSYALRLARWPDDRPVWTGSCPCQPFSSATRGRTTAVDLWPSFRLLITSNRPSVIFGEQVSKARDWFDGVCDDMEKLGYEIGAAVLPASSIGLDHARSRLFFVGHANSHGESIGAINEEMEGVRRDRSIAKDVVQTNGLSSRMAQLSGFGNAIVPEVACRFIEAFCDATLAKATT